LQEGRTLYLHVERKRIRLSPWEGLAIHRWKSSSKLEEEKRRLSGTACGEGRSEVEGRGNMISRKEKMTAIAIGRESARKKRDTARWGKKVNF